METSPKRQDALYIYEQFSMRMFDEHAVEGSANIESHRGVL